MAARRRHELGRLGDRLRPPVTRCLRIRHGARRTRRGVLPVGVRHSRGRRHPSSAIRSTNRTSDARRHSPGAAGAHRTRIVQIGPCDSSPESGYRRREHSGARKGPTAVTWRFSITCQADRPRAPGRQPFARTIARADSAWRPRTVSARAICTRRASTTRAARTRGVFLIVTSAEHDGRRRCRARPYTFAAQARAGVWRLRRAEGDAAGTSCIATSTRLPQHRTPGESARAVTADSVMR